MKKVTLKGMLFLPLILFLFTLNSYSQKDFRNGYIVTYENDTTHGLINYRGNKANAKQCVYKKTPESKPVKYSPEEIQEYRFINSKFYVAKELHNGNKSITLFLEYLIDGIVDIYYYRDNDGEHYFVDKGDGKLIPLKNEDNKIKVHVGSGKIRTFIKKTNEYKGALKYVFRKSPEIQKKVQYTRLAHKDLINIAKDYHYNVCEPGEKCLVFSRKPPKIKVNFGVSLQLNQISTNNYAEEGLTYDNLRDMAIDDVNPKNPKSLQLYYTSFTPNIFPSVGMYLNINMPSLSERVFLQYDLSIGKWEINSNEYGQNPNKNIYNTIKMGQTTLSNAISLRYSIPFGKVNMSFILGSYYDHYLNSSYKQRIKITSNPDENIRYIHNIDDYAFNNDGDYGYLLGVGMSGNILKRNASINFTYRRGFALFPYLKTNYLSINLGYELGK